MEQILREGAKVVNDSLTEAIAMLSMGLDSVFIRNQEKDEIQKVITKLIEEKVKAVNSR